jgi:hypothetical protein
MHVSWPSCNVAGDVVETTAERFIRCVYVAPHCDEYAVCYQYTWCCCVHCHAGSRQALVHATGQLDRPSHLMPATKREARMVDMVTMESSRATCSL